MLIRAIVAAESSSSTWVRAGLLVVLLTGLALSVALADERAGEAASSGTEGPNEQEEEERSPLRIESRNTEPLPLGQIELEYRYTFIGSGGARPYSWRLSEASDPLPAGMFLDSETGRLEGEPEEEGHFEITVQLVDRDGASSEKTFELHIRGDPFTLRELEPSNFDGRVHRDEYAATAPFRFGLGGDGSCTVYIRQSGGTITFAMVIEQVFLVQNRVRLLLAKDEEPIQRVYALEFDPFNAGYDTFRHMVLLRNNPFDDSPAWQPRLHVGWLARAYTRFADRWHCEFRINLSELGIMPGTSAGNLLVSFEIVGPDPDQGAVFAPPRDRWDAYGNRSNYVTLRSEDMWGARDERVLISASQIRRAREREEAIDVILGTAIVELDDLQMEIHELARQIERDREQHGEEEIDEATRRKIENLVERYLEAQEEYVRGVEQLLEIDSNFYPYMYNIAHDFAAQARRPLPGVDAEVMWQQALRFTRRARQHNPSFLPARILEAQALQRLGRYSEALSHYEQMLIEYPGDIALALEVGRMHILMERSLRRELRETEEELHELLREITRFEARLAELQAGENGELDDDEAQEHLRLTETALERLREQVEPKEEQVTETRATMRHHNHEALGVLGDVALRHRDNGRVTLACATLLYNLDEREAAEPFLTMTLDRLRNNHQLDLAIELITFLGRHGDFERMRSMARRLSEEDAYGELGSFHYAVSQQFKYHHKYEDALLYASKAAEHMPEIEGDERTREAHLRLRNMIVIDLLIALGNAEEWERAASYVRTVTSELHELTAEPDEDAQPDARRTEISERQLWQRYRELLHYPHYVQQEEEARAEDETLRGTERENPRVTLRFYERDGSEFGDEPVVIELFRNDAGDLVRHLEQAIAEGWYDFDEQRDLYGGMIQSLRRAHQLTVGPSGPGTREAPTASLLTTGRRHFRGSVSLRTAGGEAGLALQINTATTPWLNERDYPVIGRVISGMDVVDRIYSDRLRVEVSWQD